MPAPSSSSARDAYLRVIGRSLRPLVLTTLLTLIPLGGSVCAQMAGPGMPDTDVAPTPGTSATRPRFSVDATLQNGEGGPEVRIDYRMGREELLFQRSSEGYRAAYEVRVIFYKSHGGAQVTGDLFERNLHVRSYAETRMRNADIIDHVSLKAPPGKYRVRVVITDLVAERASGTEIPFEVLAAAQNVVWFTDLSLGTAPDSTLAAGTPRDRFVPTPSRRFGLDLGSMAILGEIVDGRPIPASGSADTYRIGVRILNDGQEVVWQADTTLSRAGSRTPFLLRPRLRTLPAGTYRVVLDLLHPQIIPPNKKKATAVRRERSFDVEQTSENLSWESRSSLEVLRYIATDAERDQIDRIDGPDARKAFWENFWRRRDPTPDTERNEAQEEFYRRVQYANQHFSAGTAGWRTDMGRIYIKLGAPDEVVRNPFNFDRPPEEIWYYYQSQRRYVFVDRNGIGQFQLDESVSSKLE
jgi:GWxTD domain-containing protein